MSLDKTAFLLKHIVINDWNHWYDKRYNNDSYRDYIEFREPSSYKYTYTIFDPGNKHHMWEIIYQNYNIDTPYNESNLRTLKNTKEDCLRWCVEHWTKRINGYG